ncbi:hypothetical protein AK830_g2585 [Neonectria ditissima]|uniref:C2H2-type domain-containing protein n=1 Tax=Neonectria ditissima TaxID=78410 RepID=A0A0P7BEE5_9HYPO|nr:hypothetical protein AK830_g2585 [Neonectria ditissima]
MNPHLTILSATDACRKAFSEAKKVPKLMENDWAENRLELFDDWASSVAASSPDGDSLDSRLTFDDTKRIIIAINVESLGKLVEDCIALGEPGTKLLYAKSLGNMTKEKSQHYNDFDSSEVGGRFPDMPANPLRTTMKAVDKQLALVDRLKTIIRPSSYRCRLVEADRHPRVQAEQELRDHLTAYILSRGPFSPDHVFSPEDINASKLSPVQEHLIRCNLIRRNRFLYAQKHSKSQTVRPPLVTPSEPSEGRVIVHEQPEIKTAVSDKTEAGPSRASGIFPPPRDLVRLKAPPTCLSATADKLDYPPPPEMAEGAPGFICPCCCELLPTMMAEKRRWKKHLEYDLFPYTCVLPDCPNPGVFYRTKDAWKTHLFKGHHPDDMTWKCIRCPGSAPFEHVDLFVSHMLQNHAEDLEYTPSGYMSASKWAAPGGITSCPLCPLSCEDGTDITPKALLDHIAEEVHAFSLKSLPWEFDGLSDSQTQTKSNELVLAWLASEDMSQGDD